MTTYHQIKKQHQYIKELTDILRRLITDKSFVEMETTCNLFFSYSNKVDSYFKMVETSVYQHMLVHSEEAVKKTAYRFMAGSCGIKRLFAQYKQTWCHNKKLRVRDHARFVQESEDIYKLILQRINDEANHLYPVIREMSEASKQSKVAAIA